MTETNPNTTPTPKRSKLKIFVVGTAVMMIVCGVGAIGSQAASSSSEINNR